MDASCNQTCTAICKPTGMGDGPTNYRMYRETRDLLVYCSCTSCVQSRPNCRGASLQQFSTGSQRSIPTSWNPVSNPCCHDFPASSSLCHLVLERWRESIVAWIAADPCLYCVETRSMIKYSSKIRAPRVLLLYVQPKGQHLYRTHQTVPRPTCHCRVLS